MMAGRLRECLKTLRWDASDLVATISCGTSEVAGWLDGRTKVPVSVVAWLEALVKAHQTSPPPSLSIKRAVEDADESLGLKRTEASRRVTAAQGFFPRRALAAKQSSAAPQPSTSIDMKGVSNGSHTL